MCIGSCKNWESALEVLNRAIAASPSLVPCLVEKARVMVNKGDWSQAEVMADRAVAEDKSCVLALRILALHSATQVIHSLLCVCNSPLF